MANVLEKLFNHAPVSPFREFSRLEHKLDRALESMMQPQRWEQKEMAAFSPSCEITEEEDCYTLKFDIPGVKKEDVKVEVANDHLVVSAERREEKSNESKKTHLSEVFYGTYTRSFTLPGPINEKMVDAKFENGILTIIVPKTEVVKTKQIAIQ
jgi:HSP20 family protein